MRETDSVSVRLFWILLTLKARLYYLMLARLWTDRRARNVCLEDEVRLDIEEHRDRKKQHSQRMKSLVTAFVLEILYSWISVVSSDRRLKSFSVPA
jgi:hypothetical protein